MTSTVTSTVSEAQRYQRATALTPRGSSLEALVDALGDPSWRIRKAALAVVGRFSDDPLLVPALIAGLASDDNAGLRNACSEALTKLGDAAVVALTNALRTSDVDQRKFVVEILGVAKTAEARAALTAALDDGDVNVRAAVAEALGRMGGDDVVAVLRQKLTQSRGDVQETVYLLDALAAARARVDFAELAPLVGLTGVARSLFRVLGACGDEGAYGPLLNAMLAGNAGNRHAAIVALAELLASRRDGPALASRLRERPGIIERLEHELAVEDDPVIAASIAVLRTLDDATLAPKLLAAAAVSHTAIEAAMAAVTSFGARAAAPLLAAADSVGVEARVLFLEAVEVLGDAASVPDLLDLAAGLETRTSEAALRALGSLAGAEHIEALMNLARREETELADQAAQALASVSARFPDATAQRIREAIARGDVRPVWMVVLGAVGREEDIEVVRAACHHGDPAVRRAALEAAPTFGPSFPFSALVYALADEQSLVRQAAARGLACYRDAEVARALITATHDPDTWVVTEALRSLGAVGGEAAAATLLTAVRSHQSPVAIAALQSLFLLNPTGVEDAVRNALGHVDPEVVREAIDVSIRLPEEAAREILLLALSHRAWTVRRAAAESLANRVIAVPSDALGELMSRETEELVREELERVASVGARA